MEPRSGIIINLVMVSPCSSYYKPLLLIALVFKSYSEPHLLDNLSNLYRRVQKQEMELSKQEMELSKQEMELTKQEMELFLLFSYLGTKNSFYKMFCIFTKDSKASI